MVLCRLGKVVGRFWNSVSTGHCGKAVRDLELSTSPCVFKDAWSSVQQRYDTGKVVVKDRLYQKVGFQEMVCDSLISKSVFLQLNSYGAESSSKVVTVVGKSLSEFLVDLVDTMSDPACVPPHFCPDLLKERCKSLLFVARAACKEEGEQPRML